MAETELLTIEAASRESAIALAGALATFGATLSRDGGCFVTVELGNEQRTVEVFATISDVVARQPQRAVIAYSMSAAEDDAPESTN